MLLFTSVTTANNTFFLEFISIFLHSYIYQGFSYTCQSSLPAIRLFPALHALLCYIGDFPVSFSTWQSSHTAFFLLIHNDVHNDPDKLLTYILMLLALLAITPCMF